MPNAENWPAVGQRVMWEYGRKEYATYGEIGIVREHLATEYVVEMDDEQPFHRACFGSKSKRTGHKRTANFTTDSVRPLHVVYRENADRMRRIAEDWEDAANASR